MCPGWNPGRGAPTPGFHVFPCQSWTQEPTGSAGHTCRRNSAALPAFSDKRSVYSRRADSCPSATFIYKMLVKLLTVGIVEEKLKGKLTFLDLEGAHSMNLAPLSIYWCHYLLASLSIYDFWIIHWPLLLRGLWCLRAIKFLHAIWLRPLGSSLPEIWLFPASLSCKHQLRDSLPESLLRAGMSPWPDLTALLMISICSLVMNNHHNQLHLIIPLLLIREVFPSWSWTKCFYFLSFLTQAIKVEEEFER